MLEQEDAFVHCRYENQILHITMKNKLPTDDEWQRAKTIILSYFEANLKENQRFAIICDMRNVPLLPIHRTQDWITFLNTNKQRSKDSVLCTCIVIDNIVIQTSMKLFFTLYKSVRPVHFIRDVKYAQQHINDALSSSTK